ncbi:transmembrane protein 256 isoform X1 [Nilaparvata lugens]|uniref:transmembrane protein 256 isoform X1 n=1 Tax=Nilaparvata lugens TaxID=108931 RepID=UPI000B987529|nr:transmembrane protein 256 isoform X1 [Nilaparvata lugens]
MESLENTIGVIYDNAWNYILKIPYSQETYNYCYDITRQVSNLVTSTIVPKPAPTTTVVMMDPLPLYKMAGSGMIFVRIAGVLGTTAVGLAAYGAHSKFSKEDDAKMKMMFEISNKYHFIHALALLGVPMCRFPTVTGTLLVTGTVMFCGTSYYRALTGDGSLRKITPIGGTLLIFGWLSMVL